MATLGTGADMSMSIQDSLRIYDKQLEQIGWDSTDRLHVKQLAGATARFEESFFNAVRRNPARIDYNRSCLLWFA